MILFVHMLFGAAIASKLSNPILAVLAAFLSHYFLDLLPHAEYDIGHIHGKFTKKGLQEFLTVILDLFLGLLLVFLFSKNNPVILISAIFAIAPDGFTALNYIFPAKIGESIDKIHRKNIHFLKYKKIPLFWRISTQAGAVAASLWLFLI